MNNRVVILVLIFWSLLLPAGAQAESAHKKLSPQLQMLTSGNPDLVEIAKRRVHLKTEPEYAEPMVDTLVLFQGNPGVLEAYGARIHSVLGNEATVDIPLRTLEMVANHPNVIRIEEARRLKPRLDVSVPETGANGVPPLLTGLPNIGPLTGANPVWGSSIRPLPPPWTGNRGQNVVVGIVDTGIDLNHPDFKDGLGKTRILYLWDQTVNGTHPTVSYGNECTKQQIDAGTCTETDTEGHGTHVMGIAAGNGSATGNSQPAYRFIGMAPEANLIVVKTDFFTTHIQDGMSYIEAKAASLGLPVVINLSVGTHFGPHDGTSSLETAIDNASGTGQVIVAAAGNEAVDNIHASGTVANGGVDTVSFSVRSGSSDVVLDLWYPGADQMGVKVATPSSTCTNQIQPSGFRYPGNATVASNTACGEVIIATPGTDSVNGDHEIIIALQNGTSPVKVGTWTFTLTGSGCVSSPSCVTNGAFDVWVNDESPSCDNTTTNCATFADHIDSAKTVGMPATATKAIAVGAYKTKDSWTSSNGPGMDNYPPSIGISIGDITFFSSLGPRRGCSNTNNSVCKAVVQKPELAAPGEEIMSSHAANTTTIGCFDLTSPTKCLDPDVKHIIFQGTSMSTPHVTGAAALLLAKNAALTSDEVKSALTASGKTRTDSFTETPNPTPNDTWGYGKLAIDLAIGGVGSIPPPGHAPFPPTGIKAVPGPGSTSVTVSWSAITNDIYLDGYNVYESSVQGGPYGLVNPSLVSANSFTVTGLQLSTTYYFVVTSVDTPGLMSAPSKEANAMTQSPPPPGNSGGCGMIDLNHRGPSNPSEAISYLLTLLLPLVLIRMIRRLRVEIGIRPIPPVAFDDHS